MLKKIVLLERYSSEGHRLYESFRQIDCEILVIVVEENDFLPESIVSIYDLVVGNYRDGEVKKVGKPKYFNEVVVPDTWSIQAGDEESGTISYQQVEKGKIHYANLPQKRLVQAVDWYDRVGIIRFKDHYNRYGDLYARTVYDAKGKPMSKSVFSAEGKEVIVENYITHDIILNDGNIVKIFRTKESLIRYYFKKLGLDQCKIYFNSLSNAFLISNRLDVLAKEDVLFWQETVENDVPGNMRMILEGRAFRCDKVMVQTRSAYNRLVELGVSENKIRKLGFIYPFERENGHQCEALICTNSDRIEHCEELIKALPQMHFHIAALTWMSEKLFDLGRYENVSLYPGVESNMLDELFRKCDYYFDINYQAEIVSAVYRAFLHNQLIFAFCETVHEKNYIADKHIYPMVEFEGMVRDVRRAMTDESIMVQWLKRQQNDALAETKESYMEALNL